MLLHLKEVPVSHRPFFLQGETSAQPDKPALPHPPQHTSSSSPDLLEGAAEEIHEGQPEDDAEDPALPQQPPPQHGSARHHGGSARHLYRHLLPRRRRSRGSRPSASAGCGAGGGGAADVRARRGSGRAGGGAGRHGEYGASGGGGRKRREGFYGAEGGLVRWWVSASRSVRVDASLLGDWCGFVLPARPRSCSLCAAVP